MPDAPTIGWCERCGSAICTACQPDELAACEASGLSECAECSAECKACLAAEGRDVASDAARHDLGGGLSR